MLWVCFCRRNRCVFNCHDSIQNQFQRTQTQKTKSIEIILNFIHIHLCSQLLYLLLNIDSIMRQLGDLPLVFVFALLLVFFAQKFLKIK